MRVQLRIIVQRQTRTALVVRTLEECNDRAVAVMPSPVACDGCHADDSGRNVRGVAGAQLDEPKRFTPARGDDDLGSRNLALDGVLRRDGTELYRLEGDLLAQFEGARRVAARRDGVTPDVR